MLDPHDRRLHYGVEWRGGDFRKLCSDPGAVRVCSSLLLATCLLASLFSVVRSSYIHEPITSLGRYLKMTALSIPRLTPSLHLPTFPHIGHGTGRGRSYHELSHLLTKNGYLRSELHNYNMHDCIYMREVRTRKALYKAPLSATSTPISPHLSSDVSTHRLKAAHTHTAACASAMTGSHMNMTVDRSVGHSQPSARPSTRNIPWT
jgi:hypothetical protein